jgi:hypothetical protein
MYQESDLPGSIIGYRKNGAPIRLQAGGDPTHNDPADEPKPGKTFTQEDFDKALQRERDKLYGRLTTTEERAQAMAAEVKELQEERKRREREDAKRQKDAETAAKAAQEAELSARELIDQRQAEWEKTLADQQNTWQTQLTGMQQQIAERDAILAKERELAALASYAQQQVAAAQNEIAPELLDYIGGNTQAEIDASIELAKAKTTQILTNIQQAQTAQRAAMPGVSAAGFTPTGPIDAQGGTKTYTPEEIAAMPMSEYAKLRPQIGIGGGANNRGLFG